MAAPVVPSSSIVNELLDEHNYDDWSVRVKIYLKAKGLWSVIEEATHVDPPEHKDKSEAWDKRNLEALHVIHLCCGNVAFKVIRDGELAHKAWNALSEFGRRSGDLQSDHVAKPVEVADAKTQVDEGNAGDKDVINDDEAVNYDEFFLNAKHSKWDLVMEFINKHPEVVTAAVPADGGKTVIHYAVKDLRLDIVEQLMPLINDERVLETQDGGGYTALEYCYIQNEMVEIAICLIRKKKELAGGSDNPVLLLEAFMKGGPDLADCLFNDVTEFKTDDPYAAQLLSYSFSIDRFDIACKLLNRNPNLAIAEDLSGNCPLNKLLCTPSAFLSGRPLTSWEKRIYDAESSKSYVKRNKGSCLTMGKKENVMAPTEASICKGKPTHVPDTIVDIPTSHVHNDKKGHRRCPSGLAGWIVLLTWTLQGRPGILRDNIRKMKLNHFLVHEILVCICKVLTTKEMKKYQPGSKQNTFVEAAMFQAAERGIVEFLIEILKVNPYLSKIINKKGQNLFQVAVQYRQEGVFNLIHGFTRDNIKTFMSMKDLEDNNMLHMMGISSPSSHTNLISGAALQMQNELQWLKRLELMASPEDLEAKNKTLDMTPREFFSKNHVELMKEGEKSMKETATACTVIGALIVTMMFAAAFKLPTPLKENSGTLLIVSMRFFILADVISLSSSTYSVLLFLGILTSRYAEQDFLYSLPVKMLSGLGGLLISVVSMALLFTYAIIIILPPEDVHWMFPLSIVFAWISISALSTKQYPFLLEIGRSTFRRLLDKENVQVILNIGKVQKV